MKQLKLLSTNNKKDVMYLWFGTSQQPKDVTYRRPDHCSDMVKLYIMLYQANENKT